MRFVIFLVIVLTVCYESGDAASEDETPEYRHSFPSSWIRKKFSDQSKIPNNLNNSTENRNGRLFNLFTFVKFPNDDCVSQTQENGTCYTTDECRLRGGISSGYCAQGFGVCCLFSYSCGQSTYNNNSYFSHSSHPAVYDATGSCQLTVNKMSPNICQLRLDFYTLVLSQPETNDSLCSRDQFLVTGGSRIPSICGTNTGQHMYVEMGSSGNNPITLTVVTSGTGFGRQWRIRITQISCDSVSRADNSCLQYFTGVSGTIRSFNYDGTSGRQLSNQDYTICIRTENNFCGISYSLCTGGVFSISGPTAAGGGGASGTGTTTGALVGSATCTSDWLTIPCASDNGRSIQNAGSVCQDRLCGDAFNSVSSANSATVISTIRPFRMGVHFDAFEGTVPTIPSGIRIDPQINNRGFCLNFVQQPCTT